MRFNFAEIRRRRTYRMAVSPFTVFLLGFSLLYHHTYLNFTITLEATCQNAIVWLDGWYRLTSPLQMFGYAIFLLTLLWLLKTFFKLWRPSTFSPKWRGTEEIFQGLLIGALVLSYAGLFSSFFILGPVGKTYSKITSALFNYDEVQLYYPRNPHPERIEWPFDFPKPPVVGPPPRRDRKFHKPVWFASSGYLLWSDYKGLYQCYADFQSRKTAYVQAREEYEIWDKRYRNQIPQNQWWLISYFAELRYYRYD